MKYVLDYRIYITLTPPQGASDYPLTLLPQYPQCLAAAGVLLVVTAAGGPFSRTAFYGLSPAFCYPEKCLLCMLKTRRWDRMKTAL